MPFFHDYFLQIKYVLMWLIEKMVDRKEMLFFQLRNKTNFS